MLAANEWRKYEESYLKYGIDMQPSSSVEAIRKEREKKAVKSSVKVRPRGRLAAMLLILFICICGITLVWLNAYQSDINYDIYQLSRQANSLDGEISNLRVSLNSENHLDEIEEYASYNLGMAYPSQSQYVYVGDIIGSTEVDGYIDALSAQQRGIAIQEDHTLTEAAMDLFHN